MELFVKFNSRSVIKSPINQNMKEKLYNLDDELQCMPKVYYNESLHNHIFGKNKVDFITHVIVG